MKKNFNVNIGGTIFHIDEDAFEKLTDYLERLKVHFRQTEGKDEIIADIESRIAEMLNEKSSHASQVITLEDIEEIIALMGQPVEIGTETAEGSGGQEKHSERPRNKRLYRDPDNKVVAGVCSGIAAYFNTDPIWFRLAFVVVTLIGFGSGLLAYLILWVAVPQAATTAEKLEMKGEPVNISNIEKSIREEFKDIESKLKDLTHEAKDTFRKKKVDNQTFFEKAASFILQIFRYIFKAFAVFVGILVTLIGIFLIVGLISSLFFTNAMLAHSPLGVANISIPAVLQLFFSTGSEALFAVIGICLLIGVPLLMLIYNGIKLIFGFRPKSRFIGATAFSLWIAGLVMAGLVALHLVNNFSHRSVSQKKYQLAQPAGRTLSIDVARDERISNYLDFEDALPLGKWNLLNASGSNLIYGTPDLSFIRNDVDSFQLVVYSVSRGRSGPEARKYSEEVHYNFTQTDTSLVLDPFFTLSPGTRWHAQNVKLVIKVPVGRSVFLNKSLEVFNFRENSGDSTVVMEGKRWKMTESGLKRSYFEHSPHQKDTLRRDTVPAPEQ